jgi:hypothetical protein
VPQRAQFLLLALDLEQEMQRAVKITLPPQAK